MTLGILLPLGGSLVDMAMHGQAERFVKYYLGAYSKVFFKIYIFSYQREKYKNLPRNCQLVCPPFAAHRYFYGLLLPFIHKNIFCSCDIFRCFHPSAAISAIVGKLFFGKKFIFNYNYDYLEWAKVEGKSYLVPFLFIQQWLAFKFCNSVFVADENMEKYARKFVPSRKITIIRNGVDTTVFRPLPRKKEKKEKIILSVGRLEPQKNYELLIRAVALLKNKASILLVGRGALKDKLGNLAKELKVELQVINVIPHLQLPEIYNRANIYVQTSFMEAPVKTL
ncbi:glycosyltransferase family 4 protein, partial [Candidatus Gottesmanbacteria bacterium]|nr:glycosyltransferase family 4 protein [Candidatus Gottesmanbacteria bacterium]